MQLTLNSRAALDVLAKAAKTINPKSPLHILSYFRLSLDGEGRFTVTASNPDQSVVAEIPVTTSDGEGAFCLEVKRTLDILKAIPDVPVRITAEGVNVTIQHPGGKFRLTAVDAADYPMPPEVADGEIAQTISLPKGTLETVFDSVGFAVGEDELRPQMRGILFDVKPDGINFVATDTRALAKYTLAETAASEFSFILPSLAIPLIRAFTAGLDVRLDLTPNAAIITAGTSRLQCKLVKGVFPDYNRVIPKSNNLVATVDRRSLMAAVSRAELCTSVMKLVRLRFDADTVTLSACDEASASNAEETMPCDYSGSSFQIGFNASYLHEVLAALTADEVTIAMADTGRPAVLSNADGGNLTVILMPMQVVD